MSRPRMFLLMARALVALALGQAVAVAIGADAPASQPAAAILCPVTAQPVDRDVCDRFRGRWVYFATDAARQAFVADPTKYADGLRTQWDADVPLRMQVRCPVTGEPIDPTIFVGRGLKAIYFATEDARHAWEKDSARFAERLERDGYTFQTQCAACGGLIVPSAKKTIDGRELYFCCMGCPLGCEKDKAACLKRVDEQIAAHRAAFERASHAATQPASSRPAPATQPAAASPP